MKKALVVLLVVSLVLAVAVTAALAAGYPGTVLWKDECPPWATLRINEAPTGWQGVECYTFDAAGKK
jgi:hypothetical protein